MPRNAIRELRTAKGLTGEQLAELVGTSQQQVQRLEAGARRLTHDWAERIARALKVDIADVLREPAGIGQTPQVAPVPPGMSGSGSVGPWEVAPAPPPRAAPRGQGGRKPMIPVRSGRGGDGDDIMLEDEPVDYIPTPGNLADAKDAYAIYMVGDSMSPRYEPGEILHVNPHKPPRVGRFVVVYKAGGAVLVKQLVRLSPADVVLRSVNPDYPDPIVLDRAAVRAIHLVVGTQDG